MTDLPTNLKQPLAQLLLALADDKLMLGHRNSDWTGLGPILEEDIAFSHMAQDEMAHAQLLYEMVGELTGKTADELAFGRKPEEYRCAAIVEVPDEFDWATALARKFFCDHFDVIRLGRLAKSSWKPLAERAARIGAEEALHVEHVDGWLVRLGRGTGESKSRMQKALDALTPLAAGLWEPVEGEEQLVSAGTYPPVEAHDFKGWRSKLTKTAQAAGLTLTLNEPRTLGKGGRRGVHTKHLKELLDEMCEVYRVEPGAAW
ncbi:MAG: phenylacetate-CoA oxygenase subunit PaaC [Phycisphaerales bacterium]|nr:phenylacetate-CoA oxygenase subunit PaaC [Phycisphaerales bacterium]MCI0629160.1 phenylacetate-CoA oxygenase subunit PaaC [Phycisphaerales bacterium]MCI0674434.1 phenylacetate-CoA oxygenase subunit PaaC [Phycisphaerales bacterium]